MAETKYATIRNDTVPIPCETKGQAKNGSSQSSALSVFIDRNPLRAIWDSSLDEVTATVLAELRF